MVKQPRNPPVKDGEYETDIICGNCGANNILHVKEGRTVKDHLRLKSEMCENCKRRIKTYSLEHKGL